VITVLQRVCWNTNSWKAPSGTAFDSGNPGEHGFGNEEWNFCTDDAFEGNLFGWLYWRAKGFSDLHFQILFWTIHPSRKEWLIVGAYHDATLATDEELRKLDSFFVKTGVGNRRRMEVIDAVRRPDHVTYIRKHPPAARAMDLRFKCPVDKVQIYEPYLPYRSLPKRFQSRNARFKNPTIIKESITTLLRLDPGRSRLNCARSWKMSIHAPPRPA